MDRLHHTRVHHSSSLGIERQLSGCARAGSSDRNGVGSGLAAKRPIPVVQVAIAISRELSVRFRRGNFWNGVGSRPSAFIPGRVKTDILGGVKSIPFASKDRVLYRVFVDWMTVRVCLKSYILDKDALLAHAQLLA